MLNLHKENEAYFRSIIYLFIAGYKLDSIFMRLNHILTLHFVFLFYIILYILFYLYAQMCHYCNTMLNICTIFN